MEGTGPGILPKSALFGSKLVYKPFTVPKQWTESMDRTGQTLNSAFGNIAATMGQAYTSLEPRGPAKWLAPLFDKLTAAAQHSAEIGTRNKEAFWSPFSDAVEGVGRALASPGAYYYLHKAGMEQPTQDAIKGVLNTPLFSFPAPAPA